MLANISAYGAERVKFMMGTHFMIVLHQERSRLHKTLLDVVLHNFFRILSI